MTSIEYVLHYGFIGKGIHRTPIAGDTTRLPFAADLSPLERKLAFASKFLASRMPGSQALRQIMGHSQFGARVEYGDCLFITISPNEQQSALVLRLSRFRENDPFVQHGSAERKKIARQDYPPLEEVSKANGKAGCDEKLFEIDLPEYDLRRANAAKDPHAVMEAYKVEILLRLATLLGVRMCPKCPRCNETGFGCQDKFGSNMRPGGGVLGGVVALGGGTEHQGYGTPHLHVEIHVCSIYQYGNMQDVVKQFKEGFFTLRQWQKYQEWFHREDILHEQVYKNYIETIEEDWQINSKLDC